MTRHVEHIEFQTALQLIEAIKSLAGDVTFKASGSLVPDLMRLDEVYIKDIDGHELSEVALEQEVLSDGSVVFNLILSQAKEAK